MEEEVNVSSEKLLRFALAGNWEGVERSFLEKVFFVNLKP